MLLSLWHTGNDIRHWPKPSSACAPPSTGSYDTDIPVTISCYLRRMTGEDELLP